jgi:hypothetical protein
MQRNESAVTQHLIGQVENTFLFFWFLEGLTLVTLRRPSFAGFSRAMGQ